MGVRNTVNRALRKTAGVEVVRTETIKRLKGEAANARKVAKQSRKRADEARGQVAAAKQNVRETRGQLRQAKKQIADERLKYDKLHTYVTRQVWDIPPDYHPDMQWIWPKVKDRTMVGHAKLNYFLDAVRYVEQAGIEGDIVECGVWRGGAMLGCVLTLDLLGSHERDLYLYDTYEGMAAPTERDVHLWHGRTAAHELEHRTNKAAPIWEPGLIEDVKAAFDETRYPREKMYFVKGKVEDTIPETVPEKIAILRLDTDWYESTKHELEHMYPRLVPGGILIIDDYGSWQGSRDATDEYFADHPEKLYLVRTGKGRAGIKPGLAAGS